MAEALAGHGRSSARLWFTARHGWDEPTPIGPFMAFDVHARRVRTGSVASADFGLARLPAGGSGRRRCRRQLRRAARGVRRRGSRRASRRAAAAVRPGARQSPAAPLAARRASARAAQAIDSGGRAHCCGLEHSVRCAALRARAGCSMSEDFLDAMAARAPARAARAARREPYPARASAAREAPTSRRARLAPVTGGFDVIAELKLRSPAAGALDGRASDRLARVSRPTRAPARPRSRC